MKVLLTWFATEAEIQRVRRALPAGTEVVAPATRDVISPFEVTYADVADLAADADVIIGRVVPPGIWDKAEKLKCLVWMHAGCDELDFAMLKRRGIRVANNRGANASAVAEHAIALLLAVAKKLIVKHRQVLEARWAPFWTADNMSVLLEGKTLAVIGLGQIGMGIAKRARPFGVRILGVRRHPEKGGDAFVDAVLGPKDLRKALRQADFTVLAAPLTAETRGLIGEREISAMKRGAILVNIARGNLIEEFPLYRALRKGRLGGYGGDVWWHYVNTIPTTYHFPTPSRTNLQHLPNVVCTGDQAARVAEVLDRHVAWAAENAAAFIQGRPMARAVDLDLGY